MPRAKRQTETVVQSFGVWNTERKQLMVELESKSDRNECVVILTSELVKISSTPDVRRVPIGSDTQDFIDVANIVKEMTGWTAAQCRSIVACVVVGLR